MNHVNIVSVVIDLEKEFKKRKMNKGIMIYKDTNDFIQIDVLDKEVAPSREEQCKVLDKVNASYCHSIKDDGNITVSPYKWLAK